MVDMARCIFEDVAMGFFGSVRRLFAGLFGVSSVRDDSIGIEEGGLRPSIGSGAVIHSGRDGDSDLPVSSKLPATGSELRVEGRVIRAGAFEFLAETPVGEVRGRLANPDHEPVAGDVLVIVIPAGAWKLDVMAPDENAFAGELFDADVEGAVSVFRHGAGLAWQIHGAEVPEGYEPGDVVYAWVFPDDVFGHAPGADAE